ASVADSGEEDAFIPLWQKIRKAWQPHGSWLYTIFLIGAMMMFILFGFLFYLSNVLEDSYDFTGVKKGFLLAIPLFALSIASYVSGHFVQGELRKMQWVTLIGIIITACAVSVSTLFEHYVYVMSVFLLVGIGIGMILQCLDDEFQNPLKQKYVEQ